MTRFVEQSTGRREPEERNRERVMDYIGAVREFIVENFLFGEDAAWLKEETSFLDSGVMDSTGILELIAFIQDRFGIVVEDEEVVPENFSSMKGVAAFLARKNGQPNGKNAELQQAC